MHHIINQYSDIVLGNASHTAYLGYFYTNRAEKTCYKCTTEPVNIYGTTLLLKLQTVKKN